MPASEPSRPYLVNAPATRAPDTFDESAEWLFHVRPDTTMTLWEGGATVKSCWMTEVPVVQADAEVVTARLEGSHVDYFVRLRRRSLAANNIVAGAILRSTSGTPFAWLAPGTIIEVADLQDATDTMARLCLDAACARWLVTWN